MRYCLLFFLFFGIHSFAQIDVTFRVDLQYQFVSENGVHIAGSMQGWDPSSTPLSNSNEDNIWEVTLTLLENTVYEYKFINGNSWENDESVFGTCSAGNGNRIVLTTDENMSLPVYIFNSCDLTLYGCTDLLALNFNPEATDDDGSCEYLQIEGCTDDSACNYDSFAVIDDGSCIYASDGFDCDSNCVAIDIDWIGDQDNNGFVSIDPNSGTAYITIESYPNIGAASILINDEEFTMNYTDWGANAHWYIPLELIANNSYTWSITVSNLCAISQSSSGFFTTDCQNVINGVNEDLGCGCGEPAQQIGYDCDGNCLVDTDLDGICDEFEVLGCTDLLALNFNPEATDDDGSCEYLQIEGCTDDSACNYDSFAVIDDGSCIYINTGLFSDTVLCSSSILDINIDDIYDSYLWNNGDTTNFIQINQAGSYFVTVSSSGCFTTDTIVVEYLPLPYIDIGDIFYLCNDDSLDLELSNKWATTLLVDFETGDTIFKNNLNSLYNTGQYQISVTDSEGCTGYDIFEIIDSPLPIANFDYTLSENFLTTNNLSTNANYYEWNIIQHNEISVDTSTNLNLEIEFCNNDTIMLIAYNDCGIDTMISVVNPTKINVLNNQTSIHPNPFTEKINLIGYEYFTNYFLKDLNGKIIRYGKTSATLDFHNLNNGFYYLILQNNDKYFSKKIIKY